MRSALLPTHKREGSDVDEASLLGIQRRISAQLHLHRLLVTPVHRLPSELLSEVFLHYRDALINTRDELDILFKIEFTIVCVCSSWRAAAYGTPQLWTRLTSPPAKMFLESYVHRFLPLSGTLPIHLNSRSADGMQHPFLILLRSHAFRWESACFRGRTSDLKDFGPVDAPLLQRLDLELTEEGYADMKEPLRFLKTAPQLRHVSFRAPAMSSYLSLRPASALTSLRVHITISRTQVIILALQELADTLEDLEFSVFSDLSVNHAPSTLPVELPKLERMRLLNRSCAALDFIIPPRIECLTLDGPNKKMPGALLRCLMREPQVAAGLRRLDLRGRDIIRNVLNLEDLISCFERLTGLRELSFAHPPPLAILEVLHVREDVRPLLPSLRDANFKTTRETVEAYMNFRKSRTEERMVRGVHVVALNHTAADDPRECLRV
ncbi:hypothetical protein EV715DRAFT_213476 [Schizophyllum commune]